MKKPTPKRPKEEPKLPKDLMKVLKEMQKNFMAGDILHPKPPKKKK